MSIVRRRAHHAKISSGGSYSPNYERKDDDDMDRYQLYARDPRLKKLKFLDAVEHPDAEDCIRVLLEHFWEGDSEIDAAITVFQEGNLVASLFPRIISPPCNG